MQTYKDIVDLFESASSAHLAVNTFYHGTIDKLDASSQNVKYPYIFLRPVTATGVVLNENGVGGAVERTFELYSLDIPKQTDTDYTEVLSNTEQTLYDLIAYINRGAQQQTYFVTTDTISPVNEGFNDRTAGWVATVTVTSPGGPDYCNFPS